MTPAPYSPDRVSPETPTAPPGPATRSVFRRWLDAIGDRRAIAAVLGKDLRRHPVSFLVLIPMVPMLGVVQVLAGLHEHHPKTPLLDAYVLSTLVIAATTVGQLVMEMEKGSKRLVLLRSLPLPERALVWAKFEGSCLLAVPLLVSTAAGRWWLGRSWLPELLVLTVATTAATALSLLWTIWIRNRLWVSILWGMPIFVALVFFEPPRAALFQLLRPQPSVLFALTAVTVGALEASVRILERRELEF